MREVLFIIIFFFVIPTLFIIAFFMFVREGYRFFFKFKKGQNKPTAHLNAQSEALLEESRHYGETRDTYRRLTEESDRKLQKERQDVAALETSCKVLSAAVAQEEAALVRTQEEKSALQKGIESLEREIATIKANALLPQRATVRGCPGEVFYVRVEITAPIDENKKNLTYPAVKRGATPFEGLYVSTIEAEALPPFTEEAVPWAFSDSRRGKVVVVEEAMASSFFDRLFFVGDVHGDADTLYQIVNRIFCMDASAVVVFLGDLFDRGEKSLSTVRLLVALARRFPGQILWLAGNHDLAFRYDEERAIFASDVEPSEFKDWLNEHPEHKEEGRALERIIADLPVALVLGDHWIAHGGIPQDDISGAFTSFETMSQQMLEDCVWSRMRDVKKKLVNRAHRGAEVGYENALVFFERVKATTGITIRHIVCAHQHEQKDGVGYLPFTKYFKPEDLTCQCIFSFVDQERVARPCFLTYRGDAIPVPHTF